MSAYSYKALDSNGKVVKGLLEGDSERQVRSQLRSRQLKPVEVSESVEKSPRSRSKEGVGRFFKPRISQSELSLIPRQLAKFVQ